MLYLKPCNRNFKNLGANKKKILSNVTWAMTGKVVNLASALFVGVLVARYLGPEQYGLMNYVISYVALFMVFSDFGMGDIEIRELSKTPNRKDYILGTCFRIRLVTASIALLMVLISLLSHKADSYTRLMIIAYSLTLYTNCFGIIRNYFTSIIKNEYIVKSEILRTLIGVAIKILLLLIKAPLEWFIFATVFDTVIVASGYYISYRKIVGRCSDWKFDKVIVPYVLKESFPLLLSGAAVIIYQRIDQVMIGNMLDKISVGYYATAEKFLSLILFVPIVLVQTITPMLIRIRENSNAELYEYKKYQTISVVVWLAVIMSAVVSLCSYWLIILTFGSEYSMAIPILRIIAWKTVGTALSVAAGQIIILEGIQKWAVIRNVIGCITCVGLNLLLIPKWGVIGSAFVSLITVFVAGCFANILIPPYYKIFKIELKALLFGWKELVFLKQILLR